MLVWKNCAFRTCVSKNFYVLLPLDNGVIKGLSDFMASVLDKTQFTMNCSDQLIYDQASNYMIKS